MIEALDIRVSGIVQGVGFRPFVYRMAKKYLVNGWVLNAADGVFIHAEAEGKLLDQFVIELSENAPAAAQVAEIDLKEVPLEFCETFEIRLSDEAAVQKTTFVSPDLAICDDCLRELRDPEDRRYHYPFINCTNCGPRFTIIDALPYDRKSTSMKDFAMCGQCADEYEDPLDRRFHAQPDACFECGPVCSAVLPNGEQADAAASRGTAFSRGCEGSRNEVRVASASPRTSGTTEALADVTNGMGGKNALSVSRGTTREESDAIFAEAAQLIAEGKILAVKGLGGYHLVCDANNAEAVAELRRRKRREGKAFAVMLPDVESVRTLCHVNPAEEKVLTSAQRPIVLLRKREDAAFVPGLADGLTELGVMLPYTPVQNLLFDAAASRGTASSRGCEGSRNEVRVASASPRTSGTTEALADFSATCESLPMALVMTSGNLHDEPICMNDDEAYERLSGIADAFLGNDRPILTRFDDSVVRVIRVGEGEDDFAVQFIRRARGYAPAPLKVELPKFAKGKAPVLFAAGPEQKNTFTLLREGEVAGSGEAFVSQHIGDMENAETFDAWLAAKQRFESLLEMAPELIACDAHPEYLPTKWARQQEKPRVEIQHHHAHVAAVMAEHGISEAVCGIAFDGTGYGVDGAIWGGEVLLANLTAFERFANFAYVPMPGGAAAVKNPLRMAYGVLWNFDLLDHPGAQPALQQLGEQADLCEQMIEKGLNTPMTSSVGRLFDAASALLGVCTQPTYEGEPAILLEAAMSPARGCADSGDSASMNEGARWGSQSEFRTSQTAQWAVCASSGLSERLSPSERLRGEESEGGASYTINVTKNVATPNSTAQDTSVLLLDAEPVFRALLDDLAAGVPVPVIARRFHDAFVDAVVTVAELMRALYGIEIVTLSGGVFMNRYLLENVLARLSAAGFTAAINRELPPNDGSVSFGQAVIAWAQTAQTQPEENE